MSIADDHFSILWPRHVEGMIALLSELREAFDGDLDATLILAVIGAALLPKDELPISFSYSELLKQRDIDFRKPLNTLSISQVTGIPRETVRRKLAKMEAKLWVERDECGHWKMGRRGAEDLRPMTELSMKYISSIAEGIDLARAGTSSN
ncbi:hypothetical protein [Qipengyuania vesicularis]|uniref:hypothetical protein n=1 Tax=Qipengyuania vesicularis TaxID=2867232 RepID=UPI001C88E148|nr:hypothetical protein [Qipengyuania vesicularis]MBX7527742.1 hypothetical protein [Qipengyuania vesicularis]